MGKKSRGNEYCEVCKKIHRVGKCTELSPKELSNVTADVAMALMRRATVHTYMNRNKAGGIGEFIDAYVAKEGEENGSGGDSKEDK